MRGLLRSRAPATSLLFAAIVVAFGIQIANGAMDDPYVLIQLGAIVPQAVRPDEWWRLLAAMFLHGGVLHLGVNLLGLYQLGGLFEIMFSTRRFVLIYFLTGIVASLTSAVNLPPGGSAVGASGAIFGVLGAFVLSIRRSPRWRHDPNARNLVGQFIFWIVANIVIGFNVPQIDNAAHIGGLVTGLLLGALLPHNTPPPPPGSSVIDVMPYEG